MGKVHLAKVSCVLTPTRVIHPFDFFILEKHSDSIYFFFNYKCPVSKH